MACRGGCGRSRRQALDALATEARGRLRALEGTLAGAAASAPFKALVPQLTKALDLNNVENELDDTQAVALLTDAGLDEAVRSLASPAPGVPPADTARLQAARAHGPIRPDCSRRLASPKARPCATCKAWRARPSTFSAPPPPRRLLVAVRSSCTCARGAWRGSVRPTSMNRSRVCKRSRPPRHTNVHAHAHAHALSFFLSLVAYFPLQTPARAGDVGRLLRQDQRAGPARGRTLLAADCAHRRRRSTGLPASRCSAGQASAGALGAAGQGASACCRGRSRSEP